MSRNYEVLRRANKEQDLFQRFSQPADTESEDFASAGKLVDKVEGASPTPDGPADTLKQAFPASDRAKEPATAKPPRLDLETLSQKEQELFQGFRRSADIKQDSVPISAVLADKGQDRLATHHESVDTLKDISQTFDSRKVPVHRKQPRLDLEALCREEEIKLIQRVFLSPGTGAPRVVVFSGIGHGTGCSSICGRAGETLAAQVAGTICVVDANLRSPCLHRYLGICNRAGLAEALVRSDPIRHFTQQAPKGNLWVLTSGLDVSNPYALLTSDRLRPRIAELRSEFDHVLIDTPPVNYFADARLVGQLADGIVLIIEANSTRREAVLKIKGSLQSANLRVLAAVLNKRTFPIPDYLYRKL